MLNHDFTVSQAFLIPFPSPSIKSLPALINITTALTNTVNTASIEALNSDLINSQPADKRFFTSAHNLDQSPLNTSINTFKIPDITSIAALNTFCIPSHALDIISDISFPYLDHSDLHASINALIIFFIASHALLNNCLICSHRAFILFLKSSFVLYRYTSAAPIAVIAAIAIPIGPVSTVNAVDSAPVPLASPLIALAHVPTIDTILPIPLISFPPTTNIGPNAAANKPT